MIAETVTHPEYMPTTEPWLREIPSHWRMKRLKSLLRQRSEKGYPDEPLLAATQTKGVVRKEDYGSRTVVATKDLHLLKFVKRGDFVISLRSFQGGIEYARHQGIISPAYTILHTEDQTLHGYLGALFKSRPFIGNLTLYVTGIRQGQNIDYEKLSRSFVPVPPPEEQAAIVRFLAEADRRINRLIRNKRRLIELLNEQKQAIITQAVTRGLDRRVETQPLGSAPEFDVAKHWSIVRIGLISQLRSEKNQSGLDLLSVFLGRGVIPYGEGGGQVHKPSIDLSGYQVVHVGDLVLNNQQAWRGSVGVSQYHGIISPAYVVLAIGNDLLPRFSNYLFQSRVMVSQFVTASKGVGDIQRDVYLPWLKKCRVPIPPVDEQTRLVTELDNALADIHRQLDIFQKEIELVTEYRTRLIADVVTGKLDVRAAAADLPDPADTQPEPADDLEETDLEEAELEGVGEEVAS